MRSLVLVALTACGAAPAPTERPVIASLVPADAAPDATPDAAPDAAPTNVVAEDAVAVFRAHAPQMRACYQAELAQAPTLAGKVNVTFTLAADGTPATMGLDGLTPTMVQCLTAIVQTMRFPPPGPEAGVQWRFALMFAN